jgi:hypothetical protein
MIKHSILVLAATVALGACQPGTAEREAMAADIQAAAPDQIVGYHYNRGSLIDDAVLDLFLSEAISSTDLDDLACGVVEPILREQGDSQLPVDFWVEDRNGQHLGGLEQICWT